ncbi:MAG: hypothetical protein IPJ27_06570 [Candidatus Accumulibacter sp.]|uniref:Tetratricopeptide repeat protein n=1 Tax=Candidatus Accumulibacter proximus TaxID=2954385 RepID=A0A935PXQ9_9PROT|nr:hypothetical protein [Candidatus Accumulibacter proximus]
MDSGIQSGNEEKLMVHSLAMLVVVMGWGILCGVIPARAHAVDLQCGSPFVNAVGPWDYRTARAEDKQMVEKFHYSTPIVLLINGDKKALAWIMGDFNYTLRAFPNHPGALWAVDRVGAKLQTESPPGGRWPIECYYVRALAFASNDGMVYLAYGQYLIRHRRISEAREKIDLAAKYLTERSEWTTNAQYNIGLAYFDLGKFELAQTYAELAAEGGFSLPGLKAKLQRSGHWIARKTVKTEVSPPDGSTRSVEPRSAALPSRDP